MVTITIEELETTASDTVVHNVYWVIVKNYNRGGFIQSVQKLWILPYVQTGGGT